MKKPLLEKLIQEIAMFDMDAACKLHKRKDKQNYSDSDDLYKIMIWDSEKEGNGYWSDINEKLKARRKNYHPHRDVMIELANDKTTKIEFMNDGKDAWEDIGRPSFFDDRKYRKKPKVSKKVIEYRIYLDNKNEIHAVDEFNPLPSHFKKWLSDRKKVEIEVEEND